MGKRGPKPRPKPPQQIATAEDLAIAPRRTRGGYVSLRIVTHPQADSGGEISEHVAKAIVALGRGLPRGVEVHHVDNDRANNSNRNLVICQDKAYHKLLHYRMRIKAAGGNPNTDAICSACKAVKPVSDFYLWCGRPTQNCRRCHIQRMTARNRRIRAARKAAA